MTQMIRAADHLVNLLVAQGTQHVFGVAGESYLPVLDALHGRDDIAFVTCRQEGGAAMSADAYGKTTGRPGVCFVTRGPGATNASSGVHVAFQDSTPMILFIGQVARNMTEREAFQEIDFRRMFGQMAKWVAQIDDPSRLQEYISRAYRTAMNGRPGPVVLALPEDMLYDIIEEPPAPRKIAPTRSHPSSEDMTKLRDALAKVQSPLIIAGGGGWTDAGIQALQTFAEVQDLPVSVSLRCQGLMDHRHPNFVGHFGVGPTPHLIEDIKNCDLLIAIGPRLGEMTTQGYSLIDIPVPQMAIAHVFPEAEEIGRVFEPEISLASDTESFCVEVAKWPKVTQAASGRTAQLRRKQEAFGDASAVPEDPIAAMIDHLSNVTPSDALICNGAGNYAAWLHRFYSFNAPHTQLAPTSGSMGYGLPAAIAAATANPTREVYAIAGDGCFMMTSQEMATARHHGLDITIIVVNNNRYGTIRAHQEREYPGRVSGTELTNPDFCTMAKSFGAGAARVETLGDFQEALANARTQKGLQLIEITQDPNILAPGKWLNA